MPDDAILLATGWGVYWDDPMFLEYCPYLTSAAMDWIISKKPFLLGSDSPRWENVEAEEVIFPQFYQADILMLAPLVNIETVEQRSIAGRLTVLPINVKGTCAAPCRAVFTKINDV